MTDINLIRKTLAEKYSEACGKIMHPPNQGIVRVLTNPTVKSFYLDLIYRGNDKVNFAHRMTDKDIILLSEVVPEYSNVNKGTTQIIRNLDFSYNQISNIGIEMFAKLLKECPNLESVNLQGNDIGAQGA